MKFVSELSSNAAGGEEGVATGMHPGFVDDDWDDFGSGSEASRTVHIAEDSLLESPATVSNIRQSSPTDRFIVHEDLAEPASRQRIAVQRENSEITEIRSRIYLDQPLWPLRDRQEAKLFRHFVQKLAIWVRAEALGDENRQIANTWLSSLICVTRRSLLRLSFLNEPGHVRFC